MLWSWLLMSLHFYACDTKVWVWWVGSWGLVVHSGFEIAHLIVFVSSFSGTEGNSQWILYVFLYLLGSGQAWENFISIGFESRHQFLSWSFAPAVEFIRLTFRKVQAQLLSLSICHKKILRVWIYHLLYFWKIRCFF